MNEAQTTALIIASLPAIPFAREIYRDSAKAPLQVLSKHIAKKLDDVLKKIPRERRFPRGQSETKNRAGRRFSCRSRESPRHAEK
jgi:hypothetical protein